MVDGDGEQVDGLAALVERARAWHDDDPDPATAAAVAETLREVDLAGPASPAAGRLRDWFGSHLEFGTAGLRGALGPGPNRMNRAVVARAAAGVAGWIRSDGGRSVVIGRDARHGSAAFLAESVEVLAGAGIEVHVLPEPVPTPVLAFAVRHLGTAAGIMVTASHNPAADNGYKVYDAEGRQIDPAQAERILAAMALIESTGGLPRAGGGSPLILRPGSDVVDAYLSRIVGLIAPPPRRPRPRIDVAHTALHGVGAAVVRAAARLSGFVDLHEVAEQAEPDPDFPTVAFPNPEEPGALDRLVREAARTAADVALAHDPDADRLAMAVVDPPGGDRQDPAAWRMLTGDELGWLLADHLVRRGGLPARGVVASTIVSSSLLARLAAAAGLDHVETLTGFKWLARAAGPYRTPVLAYEEALGYCIGDVVGDKDGIGAFVVACEMISDLVAAGETVADRLDDLARRFGVHHTTQWSLRLDGPADVVRLGDLMRSLREGGPIELAGAAVTAVEDLRFGSVERVLPPADVVMLHLAGGTRVVVRPSGTEPKLKAYVEVVEPAGDDLPAARARARERADAVVAALPAALGL